MLSDFAAHATVPVSNLERAKAWYRDKLGMTPKSEDPGGAWYESGGTGFALFPTPFAGTAQNTCLEWSVADISREIEELKTRGVDFDHYDMPGVEWEGDVAVMGGMKGGWFKDSEGNILSLTESRQ
jgi:catechol 2,3-dioxygenase-like lactoylglutathione lyase family enzyme